MSADAVQVNQDIRLNKHSSAAVQKILESVAVLVNGGKSPAVCRLNLEFAAKPTDMHINCSGLQVGMFVPDIFQNTGTGEQLSDVPEEEQGQLEFSACQLHFFVIAGDGSVLCIKTIWRQVQLHALVCMWL